MVSKTSGVHIKLYIYIHDNKIGASDNHFWRNNKLILKYLFHFRFF